MVEFYANGRWLVISPADSSFVWRLPDGRIATAQEIHDNPEVFRQIYARHPRYPYLFDRWSNIRWEKLPPKARAVFRLVLGEERYEKATTPKLYDKPRELLMCFSILLVRFLRVADVRGPTEAKTTADARDPLTMKGTLGRPR